jgi:hypothetical protein
MFADDTQLINKTEESIAANGSACKMYSIGAIGHP